MRRIAALILVFFMAPSSAMPCFCAEDTSSQVDARSRQMRPPEPALIKVERVQQVLKEHPIEDLKMTGEVIYFGTTGDSFDSEYRAKTAAQKTPPNSSRSGFSLRDDASAAYRSSKEVSTAHWIKGKVSQAASTVPIIANNQSKELRKLQKQDEARRASFNKSLENRSVARDSLLIKQPGSDALASEKDNE